MASMRSLFLLSVMIISSVKFGKGQESDNSSVEVPLLDNHQMPLVALFDTTKINQALKTFIRQTVEESMNERIPFIKHAVIDDIGYEPGRASERPAFTASLTRSKTLGGYEVIVFDKVWLNMRDSYDKNSGRFTAPKTGLYFISTTLMSYHDTSLHCDLWKNNEQMVRAYGTGLSTGTLNVVVALKMNDTVYVKHIGSTEKIYGDHMSTFSGYLIGESTMP